MCYSAQIWQDYRQYVRHYGAALSLAEFTDLYWRRAQGGKIRIAKAMHDAFASAPPDAAAPAGPSIAESIAAHDAGETARLEQELFVQRKRLADAERTLATRPTKRAAEHQRIATAKIAWCREKLSDLHRSALTVEDARIFPGTYAMVMTHDGGRRTVRPMRYGCRPAGKPAAYDRQFPGTYNARRDNLRGFWRGQFGVTHGVVVLQSFFENVPRHRAEHRDLQAGESPSTVVLQFRPEPAQDLLVACLWSHWTPPRHGPDATQPELLSFAAITDEPPPEVAAAGHDRCVIAIRPENLDAWLNPAGRSDAELDALLADRAPLTYAHRLAA